MAYQSGLAGHAKPCSVLIHPRIREAATPQDWFAFHNPFFAVAAGNDCTVAVQMYGDVVVRDLVGIRRAVFHRRQKLCLVHECAIKVRVGERVRQKLIERVDILIFFSQVPGALEREKPRFVWASLASILSGTQWPRGA